MATLTPFFNSIGEDAIADLKNEANEFKQVMSTTIVNSGLFGKKRERMYFTLLKSPEVPHTKRWIESKAISMPDLELHIDPRQIQVQKRVLVQKRLTKAGWILQFWGHDLTKVNINATSGYYGTTKGQTLAQLQGALHGRGREVDPLKVFERLKEDVYMRRFDTSLPYKGLPIIGMVYEGTLYRGFFENFNYSLNSTTPFTIDYNFGFVIIPPNGDVQGFLQQIGSEIQGGSTQGLVAGTITNPDGTIQKVSGAMKNAITKKAQGGIDGLSKKLGVTSYVDVTPSRVVLY